MSESLYEQYPRVGAGQMVGYAGRYTPVESSSTIPPLIERILNLSGSIDQAASAIHGRADRLFGATPESGAKAPPGNLPGIPPGEFGRLNDAVDTLDASIQRLQSADQRLSAL